MPTVHQKDDPSARWVALTDTVELPFALSRLSGEVAHQIFVRVTQNVIALGAI
jgi:hypothetical protein